MSFFSAIKQIGLRYKKIIIIIFIIWGFFSFGLGNLVSWLFFPHTTLDKFPLISSTDRILILAPHIDDEVLSSAGLIQRAKASGAEVKVVYLTNGDNNIFSVISEDKNLKLNPVEFIELGEKRMQEALMATRVLGLTSNDLVFLGFPDGGLSAMLSKFYFSPFSSQGTKFNYNPYQGTYKEEQAYTGANLVADLAEIIADFNPNIIIVSHPRDKHTDHWATFQFLQKSLIETNFSGKIFAYLIHYRMYPPEQKLAMNEFLYPPKKLFSQTGWVSFNLTPEEENKKLEAINQNKSQVLALKITDFLQSFVKKNEIFEEIEGNF
ncbi:MAG: PIG-L deacetylase family protein [Minisyncoccales bacterium]